MKSIVALVALFVMTGIAAATPTRADFAKLAATVKPGMAIDKVTAILGAPDDIKTEADPGGIDAARTVQILRWGTHGHGTFATLGAVHIMANRTVQYVFGDKPPAAAIAKIPEADLRRYLDALAAVTSYNARCDALAIIRAVNLLQPLGKDTALAVIDEFLRVSSWLDDPGREGVFLVNRVLFETSGPAPVMMVGAPSPNVANPMVVLGDLPLKIVNGYALAGMAERPEDDVLTYRKVGTIRAKPLAPSVKSLDAVTADPKMLAVVYDQALRVFGTVYRPGNLTVDSWFPDEKDLAKRWTNVKAEIAKTGATWNATTQQFELAKGATLAPLVTQYPRVWWDASVPNASKARLTFQRLSDDLVSVEWRLEATGSIAPDRVEIVNAMTKVSLGFLGYAALATGSSVMTVRMKLPRGTAVIPQLAGAIGPKLTP